MTRDETKKIIRIICDSYPNYKPSNLSEVVDVWQMMLSDYQYDHIALALKTYILTDDSGFAPSIGQLVTKLQHLTEIKGMSDMEAWGIARKAISNGGHITKSEFDSLPELVRKSIGSISQLRSWAMDENFNEAVAMSQFLKCYRYEKESQRELYKLPESIKNLISSTSEKLIDTKSNDAK